ncbi:MAG: methyltransferase domain-containing protein [Deltaproteobacteria bacterium]|nr:methyltransferase domain-containing protein [Deltaproteobacteria bacterium]
MAYDNSAYWKGIHEKYAGALRAVGHPDLSETANALKYQSEAKSAAESLEIASKGLSGLGSKPVEYLDVGAGTGYWTRLVSEILSQAGFKINVTALDISEGALAGIKEKLPEAVTFQADLKTISKDQFAERFDLVTACYCLHHLVRAADFANALSFCAASVAPGGFFLLMDPVLTMRYSPFDVIDFKTYKGNGVVRHRHFIEDLASSEGLVLTDIRPAVSFLLNGGIEAGNAMFYRTADKLWRTLGKRVFQSEDRTRLLASPLQKADETLKNMGRGYSSSILLFRKETLNDRAL